MQVYYPTAYILINKHLLAPHLLLYWFTLSGCTLCRFIAQMQQKRALFEEQAILPSPPHPSQFRIISRQNPAAPFYPIAHSAPNQILIFVEPPPRIGVSENVWFFKFELVDRANMRRKEQIYIRGDWGS